MRCDEIQIGGNMFTKIPLIPPPLGVDGKGGFLGEKSEFQIRNPYLFADVVFPRFPDGADASVFKS